MRLFSRFRKKNNDSTAPSNEAIESTEKTAARKTGAGFRKNPLSKTKKPFTVICEVMYNDKVLATHTLTVNGYTQAQANKAISTGISVQCSEPKPKKK